MTRSEFKTLAIQRILRLDGATGTELAKRGMPPGVCPEAWILDNPDAIIDVQRCYAAAGSDIVYAPTFGGNPLKLAEFGLADRTEEINRELARLSRRAVPDKFVFADIAPTGQLIEPYGELAFDEAVEIYKRQIRALLESGGITLLRTGNGHVQFFHCKSLLIPAVTRYTSSMVFIRTI